MADYSLCEALSNAARIKPTKNESAESFSKRIVKELAADDFPEDDWEALPDEAQQWVNKQIRATNERREIEPVAEYDAFYEAKYTPMKRFKSVIEHDETNVTDVEENDPTSLNVFEEEAKEPKKQPRQAKAPKPNGKQRSAPEGKPNAVYRMREMLVDNFALTPNELMERLKTEGYREISRLTATSVKADLRTTLKFLQDKALLSQPVLPD